MEEAGVAILAALCERGPRDERAVETRDLALVKSLDPIPLEDNILIQYKNTDRYTNITVKCNMLTLSRYV